MLTKEEHISYWKREADRNWETALYLQKGNHRVMALFMIHLVTEKLLKAHWVKDNFENQPPRTHDLQNLNKQTELDLPAEDYDYLAVQIQKI
ncbi:MAG: HEPN domain-containing protein [Cyclobacteriaceae bacterium]|nr:HEPN domain-containing protein [Cyclobacteriaceae bacterium]